MKLYRVLGWLYGEGFYSHFPVQILTKSHSLRAQILYGLSVYPAQRLIPLQFPIAFVDDCQSRWMKSHFPSEK